MVSRHGFNMLIYPQGDNDNNKKGLQPRKKSSKLPTRHAVLIFLMCWGSAASCLVQIITRKELNKRMISSAGTRKLYMMMLGDNT